MNQQKGQFSIRSARRLPLSKNGAVLRITTAMKRFLEGSLEPAFGTLDLVYNRIQCMVKEAVIALVDKERDGENIDRELMKKLKDFYVEIGIGKMERYEQDLEIFMLEDTTSYNYRKASTWIQEDSFFDHIFKSE